MSNLHKSKEYDLIDMFNNTSRYIDDIFTVNNPEFEKYISDIYCLAKERLQITNCLQETLVLTQNTKKWRKHKDLWPWQMTFLFFDILNAFLASSCIYVQIKKYLWWRDVQIFLQNGSATRKSQVGWPLTVCLKEQYAAPFCRSHFKYEVRSLNTQHFHSYCSYKNVLFMGQSDLDPQKIDLNLYGNLPNEIYYTKYTHMLHS